jgi:hypothetical protein
MVMSILASIFAFVFFCMSASACGLDNDLYMRNYYSRGRNNGRVAVDALGIIVGLAEIVVSIIQSAICCRTTCCGPKSGPTIVYIPQPFPVQYALQNRGVVQATSIPAGTSQFTVITPGPAVYPATGYAPMSQPAYATAAQPGPMPLPEPVPGPVAPPQYRAEGPGPAVFPATGYALMSQPAYATAAQPGPMPQPEPVSGPVVPHQYCAEGPIPPAYTEKPPAM